MQIHGGTGLHTRGPTAYDNIEFIFQIFYLNFLKFARYFLKTLFQNLFAHTPKYLISASLLHFHFLRQGEL